MKKVLAVVLFAGLAVNAVAQSGAATNGDSAAGKLADSLLSSSLTENALYSVGNLGATQLYYTYLLLGMIGDSYSKGVYDRATVLSLIDKIRNFTVVSQKSLGRLSGEKALSSDDKSLISEMNGAFDALLGQAAGLTEYVDGKDDGSKFQSYRQSAWDKISKIIGVKASP